MSRGSLHQVELWIPSLATAERGWTLMFPDRHPLAVGRDHYAAYLESEDGYEMKIVAGRDTDPRADTGTGRPCSAVGGAA